MTILPPIARDNGDAGRTTRRLWGLGCGTAVALMLAVSACSSSGKDSTRPADESGDGGAGGAGAGVVDGSISLNGGSGRADEPQDAASSDEWTTVTEDGQCIIAEDEEGCTGSAYESESLPLDIYILFDQSGSMCNCVDPPKDLNPCDDPECNKTRIEAVREAAEAFLLDPASAGIGVGLGYFGHQPIGETTCDSADYGAAIEIGTLPSSAEALVESLRSVEPTGETPTGPAIEAACQYARAWKEEHPNRKVVMLLLTDGEPKAPVTCYGGEGPCCPTLEDAVTRTLGCTHGDLPIETYVLGVGPFLENLADIAEAGGTGDAYLVEEGEEADVAAGVLDALNAIRGDAAIPCHLTLPPAPPGETLALDRVNMVYVDADCEGTLFEYVDSQAACEGAHGWYYDDPESPETIQLCSVSCEMVSAAGGRLLQTVGCRQRVRIY